MKNGRVDILTFTQTLTTPYTVNTQLYVSIAQIIIVYFKTLLCKVKLLHIYVCMCFFVWSEFRCVGIVGCFVCNCPYWKGKEISSHSVIMYIEMIHTLYCVVTHTHWAYGNLVFWFYLLFAQRMEFNWNDIF